MRKANLSVARRLRVAAIAMIAHVTMSVIPTQSSKLANLRLSTSDLQRFDIAGFQELMEVSDERFSLYNLQSSLDNF